MMGPREDDEEAARSIPSGGGQEQIYHDDSDEDAFEGADAPVRDSQRPSSDFDGLHLGGDTQPHWYDPIGYRVPPSIKHAWAVTVKWVKGPNPPRIYSIAPFFPAVQHAPLALLDRYAPKRVHKFWLLVLFYASWLLTFSLVLRASSVSASIPGYGEPVRLSCAARYWNDGNGCGLNGDGCRPFANATLAFRCPADCHKTQVLNPHAVGDQEIVYRPLVIGGPQVSGLGLGDDLLNDAIYRGDSFICASAVHAGFISDIEGGCGVLALAGEQPSFPSSKRNGISSIGFDSYFPHTFGFLSGTSAQCKDLRWPSLAVSVIFTAILSVFTTSPIIFFWSSFVILFFQTALASDPPSLTTYSGLLSMAFGRFLPAAFCGWVIYRYTVRRSLTKLTAQVEKTVLWLGPAWVGALNNETFDKIPIQRLTPHDLHAQPGAIPALIIVVLSIFTMALGQAWAFRVEGRMPRYLALYGLFVGALLIMIIVPGLSLRIHHYILALLLLPGTSFQNRPSLVYQGLLVGLFVNGIARWGFDSILQTPSDLLRGVNQGTVLPAISVLAVGVKSITFDIGQLPRWESKSGNTYDGISVLVNDVERFRGYGDDSSYWSDPGPSGNNLTWTWKRHHVEHRATTDEGDPKTDEALLPEYFRFGYMAGSGTADFGKAGRWDSDGTWTDMDPGPSL